MKIEWKQVAIAVLIGGAIGFAGARISTPYFLHKRLERGGFKEKMMDRFSKKLNLTSEQREKISSIFESSRQEIQKMQAEIKPRFEEIRTSTNAKIREVLNPEQQKKFDEMEAKWADRIKKFRGGRFGAGNEERPEPPQGPDSP